jgi:hypothetical protein
MSSLVVLAVHDCVCAFHEVKKLEKLCASIFGRVEAVEVGRMSCSMYVI